MATLYTFPVGPRRTGVAPTTPGPTPLQLRHRARAVARLLRQIDRLCRIALRAPRGRPFSDYPATYDYAAGVLGPSTSMLTGSELTARIVLAVHDLRGLLEDRLRGRGDRLARLLRAKHRELANTTIALVAELNDAYAADSTIDFDPEEFRVMADCGFNSMPELGARLAQALLCAREFAARAG